MIALWDVLRSNINNAQQKKENAHLTKNSAFFQSLMSNASILCSLMNYLSIKERAWSQDMIT